MTHTVPGPHRRAAMGERRFGAINWLGLWTLGGREVRRFVAVYTQTVLAPLATSILFLVVFAVAFGEGRQGPGGMDFATFLAPGILMMTVIQNAFANTSSSLMIAKIQGNIVDTLMPPLSAGEILTGYLMGGVVRGLVCAAVIGALVFPVLGIGLAYPLAALGFVLLASVMLSLAGLIAGIHAEKFDQMAAITNFVVTPLSFLSGTFYSIDRLPEPFWTLSHANPFFYLIDGFRHAVLGSGDSPLAVGLGLSLLLNAVLWIVAWRMLASGYRLKS